MLSFGQDDRNNNFKSFATKPVLKKVVLCFRCELKEDIGRNMSIVEQFESKVDIDLESPKDSKQIKYMIGSSRDQHSSDSEGFELPNEEEEKSDNKSKKIKFDVESNLQTLNSDEQGGSVLINREERKESEKKF